MVVGNTDTPVANDKETDLLFHALADGTRRDIMGKVGLREQSISDLARQYDMSFAAIQKHVTVLERAGLVTKRVSGRQKLVTGNVATLRRATKLLERFEELWARRIDAIDELIKETEGD